MSKLAALFGMVNQTVPQPHGPNALVRDELAHAPLISSRNQRRLAKKEKS